jgi:hypothetical protein
VGRLPAGAGPTVSDGFTRMYSCLVRYGGVLYSAIMDVGIKFRQSAFKHGVTEDDIRWAYITRKYDAELEAEGAVNKHLFIGFDHNANLIEVFYNPIDADTIRVFHAMKCRLAYIALLNL